MDSAPCSLQFTTHIGEKKREAQSQDRRATGLQTSTKASSFDTFTGWQNMARVRASTSWNPCENK